MITNSVVLAILTFGGFFVIFIKSPNWIKKLIIKFPLLFDAIACVLTYVLFGRTITALMASAMLGLMISAGLYIARPGGWLELNDSLEMQESYRIKAGR